MSEVFREGLSRSVPFTFTRQDGDNGDGLTLAGYGAVFDSEIEINSWEGRFRERVARGAFKKSLRERTPKLQFDHGQHPLIGSVPIGTITEIGEDATGLRVLARLLDNWLIQPVRDAIREGAIDGMSFRFNVIQEEWVDNKGKRVRPEEVESLLWRDDGRGPLVRTLKEVRIDEVGPVVWPAYDATSVSVRSQVIDLGRLHEPAQRNLLARAVILADAIMAKEPETTEQAGDHSEEVRDDGTPQTTEPVSAGEHVPVKEMRGNRPVDMWVRKARDVIIGIETKGGKQNG